jgi:hypothetical protein
VSEGGGGIAYGLIHDALKPSKIQELTKEFWTLAGLEAGDLLAEMPPSAALERAQADVVKGSAKARGDIKHTFTRPR